MKYRREIDGLRAVAVVPVMLFHAGFSGISGGFLGVDIFFVISGYLITSLIISDMEQGRFSIVNFYERRARRILPALFLVVLFTVPVAFFVMLPFQLKSWAESIVAVNLFVSNVYFWSQGGYFAGPNGEIPLLHTWSLAVEEQFYVVFPLFMIVVWRWRAKVTAPIIILLSVLSLAMAQWLAPLHPSFNFYLTPFRAWELLFGSLAAILLLRPLKLPAAFSQALSMAGFVMVVASLFLFTEGTLHPSVLTVVPVGGTVLLILFCRQGTLVYNMLASRVLVGIGLISYSAYLWHQPLLAFARLGFGELSMPLAFFILILALGLAWVSWKYVEQPFRDRNRFGRGQIFGLSLVFGAVLSLFAGWVILKEGFPNRFPEFQQQFVAVSRPERIKYVTQRYNTQIKGRDFGNATENRLLIIGDSFSQDFYNMILETGAFGGWKIAAVYVPTKCQIYLGDADISDFVEPVDRELCRNQGLDESAVELAQQADMVIFVASWKEWAVKQLPDTLNAFSFSPEQKVLVIGTKGFQNVNLPFLLGLEENTLADIRVPPPSGRVATNELMRQTLSSAMFVDIIDTLCGPEYQCPMFTPERALISHDGSHLTEAGAQFLGRILFDTPLLRPYRGHD